MGLNKFEIIMFWSEFICILFYGLFVEFGDGARTNSSVQADADAATLMVNHYPMYMDIHVMVFVGFGFLMSFLKNSSWTAIGFTYLIACWSIQICILMTGFWRNVTQQYIEKGGFEKIQLDLNYLILGDFGAAAVIISFGAILGKCSLFQLWVLATIEMVFYTLNESIATVIFNVKDIGGSMTIHTFGAYFGIVASYFFQNEAAIKDKDKKFAFNYYSNIVAMIGTCFLFLYWPSFNAANGIFGSAQHRAIINTLLANSTSVISACLFSRITKGGKLDMIIVVNATLAGGAALGASADLINYPFCSMIVGFVAGSCAALGFSYVQPFLAKHLRIHDSQGIQYIHGWGGLIGGFVSVISCSLAHYNFGDRYDEYFYSPAAQAVRTPREQASYQLATMAVSVGLAILGGLVGGLIASRSWFDPPKHLFDDVEHWHDCEPPHGDDLNFSSIRNSHVQHHATHDDLKGKHGHNNEGPVEEVVIVEESNKHSIKH